MEKQNYPIFVPESFENKWADLSEEDYHADKSAVNSSSLKYMVKSPFAYLNAYRNDIEKTPAMHFGSLAHMAILEGDNFNKKFIVAPIFEAPTLKGEMSTRSKAAIEMREEWYRNVEPGKVVVTDEELEKLKRMIDAIITNPVAREVLSKGKSEMKGYFRDERTGLKCRFMQDFVNFDLSAKVEFKTTQDCRWESFRRSVETLRYDIQDSFYDKGIKAITGVIPESSVWVVSESVAPYECKVHEVDEIYKASGQHEVRYCLNRIAECIKENKFPQAQIVPEVGAPSKWFEQEYQLKGV